MKRSPLPVLFFTKKTVSLVYFFVSFIASHLAQSILQHDILLEQMIYRNFTLCIIMHRALQEEAQETLDTKKRCVP
mgnify:CR=1 FL=1